MKKGEVALLTIAHDSKIKCLILYFERSSVQFSTLSVLPPCFFLLNPSPYFLLPVLSCFSQLNSPSLHLLLSPFTVVSLPSYFHRGNFLHHSAIPCNSALYLSTFTSVVPFFNSVVLCAVERTLLPRTKVLQVIPGSGLHHLVFDTLLGAI
ncbi:hypothetical protein Nepgr_019242 [Nepenthes gracilis]|uniref:Uncharacterized protein n=1 Tax=Nepenthes gracilis TaxID=150966 RepID=A0AAD3XV43_NEPGR|nr:hypothetical protein Nepgr_019242 [Nepenthes gracilis]